MKLLISFIIIFKLLKDLKMSNEIFSKELVNKTKEWLGEEGLKYFREWIEEFGKDWYFSCKIISGFPYSIHFNDGMSVRNFIRQSNLCENLEVICIKVIKKHI